RRMARRYVQRIEVVEAGFNLRTIGDRIAHRHKYVFDSLANQGDRMQVTASRPGAGQCDIDRLALQRGRLSLRGELLVESSDLGLDLCADFIHHAAKLSALLG